jgi:hypothetical protein
MGSIEMHATKWIFSLVVVSALVACGSDETAPAPAQPEAQPQPAATAPPAADNRIAATAAEVAAEARGDVTCPADTGAPPDPQAPVADIVGVRPGMTYEQAANIVMCTDDLMVVSDPVARGFEIQTYGQTVRQGFEAALAEDRINKTSKEIMAEMQDSAMARGTNRAMDRGAMHGKVSWFVGTMGLPGQEVVISAARENWFADGKQPTMDSVGQALIDKYGAPTKDSLVEGGSQVGPSRHLTWAFDPFGRPITETSPLFGQCSAPSSPGAGVNLSPDCGVVVAAQITALQANPGLVEVMSVGMVDQANGFEAITATEQGFEAMEQERRAVQTQEAAKNADAPVL